jgi:ribonuclease-3
MTNPKGDLIEHCRTNGLAVPAFETSASGPEHEPVFTTEVLVAGRVVASKQGRNKRESERAAAEAALENLRHTQETASAEGSDDEDGPWPIFPDVLVESLAIANSRVDPSRRGAQGVEEVRRLALDLYKGLLADLGEYS